MRLDYIVKMMKKKISTLYSLLVEVQFFCDAAQFKKLNIFYHHEQAASFAAESYAIKK